jgi:small acid-soluble spore protein P (minor)
MPKEINEPNPHMKTNRKEPANIPVNEPLSGSKKVKNRNHSRQNHGEGS